MELVIDISEEQYALIRSRIALIREEMRKKGYCNNDVVPVGWVAIADGTILPKGHGRLIDADTCRKDMMNSRDFEFFKLLDMQTTIVEADQAADQEAANE